MKLRRMFRAGHPTILSVAILFMLAACLLTACESEDYDSGDGRLSYLRADFADVYTDGQGRAASALTDDGLQLNLSKTLKPQWMQTADSVYRALLYYNMSLTGGQTSLSSPFTVEPLSMVQVLVPTIRRSADGLKTHPVGLSLLWLSGNARYVNMGLTVMTGRDDGTVTAQTLGIVCDTVMQPATGHRRACLRLHHDQNGAPEYYSADVYMSIPLSRLPATLSTGDTVAITLNTYGGETTREVVIGE